MIVYRVQDKRGRGPFKPGMSHRWSDEDFAPGMESLLTWPEEFGFDLINRDGRPGEHFGSAVRDPMELSRWFSKTEQEKLHKLGYRPVALRVDRVLAESKDQLVFARQKPLWRNARPIQWPL